MERLTAEIIQSEVVENEDPISFIKVLREKGSDDIHYGSFDQTHLSIAKEAGINPNDVAYAGVLRLMLGPEGIELSSAGSSIEGYAHNKSEELKTFEIIAPLVKSLSGELELMLGKPE